MDTFTVKISENLVSYFMNVPLVKKSVHAKNKLINRGSVELCLKFDSDSVKESDVLLWCHLFEKGLQFKTCHFHILEFLNIICNSGLNYGYFLPDIWGQLWFFFVTFVTSGGGRKFALIYRAIDAKRFEIKFDENCIDVENRTRYRICELHPKTWN
jgi:hypothetical protein